MRIRAVGALAASLLAASVGSAQVWEELRKQSPETIARGQTDFWTRTLGLSEKQSAELQEIHLRYASALSVAARAPGDQAQKVPAMRAAEAQKAEEILELLTPAQRERYSAFEQQMEELLTTGAR